MKNRKQGKQISLGVDALIDNTFSLQVTTQAAAKSAVANTTTGISPADKKFDDPAKSCSELKERAPTKPESSVTSEAPSHTKGALVPDERAQNGTHEQQVPIVNIDPANLVAELEHFYGGSGRLSLPEGAKTILALFTLNSYTFDVFDVTPYIQIQSVIGGCGKSTLLHHLRETCHKAHHGVAATAATIFRRIDRDKPTWLLDEAMGLNGHDERTNCIREVLDAGYSKGATVSRCVGDTNALQEFDVYCPKVFALVGSLRGTTLDRCIVIQMLKSPHNANTRQKELRRLAEPLRKKLEAYAKQHRTQLQKLYDEEPPEGYWPQLKGREQDIWGPLLMHAKLAGPEVEARVLDVALKFSGQKEEMAIAEDQDLVLIQSLKEVLEKLTSNCFSPRDLVPLLEEGDAWADRLEKCKNANAKACAIGKYLNRFGLKTRERYRGGTRYNRAEALAAVALHLPAQNATSATNATEPINTRVAAAGCIPSAIATRVNGDAAGRTKPEANSTTAANSSVGNPPSRPNEVDRGASQPG